MKAKLVKWWTDIRDSYWFVPSVMALGAIILSFVTTAFDHTIGSEWLEDIGWLYANKPAGARAVLSTVAGSMITVAGVTFSMTILSISYTTSQVGPRLLRNFMRDTANQFTLGVFISTFLYCLLVLRTVRNAETAPPGAMSDIELVAAFVPHVAVIVGLVMAILSVGVLIFFIHHIPESIHVSNIVAGVGRDLNHRISKQFPSRVGEPHEHDAKRQRRADLPDSFYKAATKIRADSAGYVQYVDDEGLLRIATEHDLVLRLRFRSGDFVTPGKTLMLVSPQAAVTEEIANQLSHVFVLGHQRTTTQNLRFLVNQLVEVAIRALSPGVNDPFTAMNCLDWLQASLENLAERELPDAHRYDGDQQLRLVAEAETFTSFAGLVFDQLRPYVATDRNTSIHMMEMLVKIAATVGSNTHRRVLVQHASALRRQSANAFSEKRDRDILLDRYRSMIRILRDPAYRVHALETDDWIGGRA